MNKTVEPKTLSGGLRVLPSKSASHRAVMMAAMAEGKTQLEPLQLSEDISATLACAQALGLTRGAAIAESETEGFVRAEIWGGGEGVKRALRELDCGESGSTLRFFSSTRDIPMHRAWRYSGDDSSSIYPSMPL